MKTHTLIFYLAVSTLWFLTPGAIFSEVDVAEQIADAESIESGEDQFITTGDNEASFDDVPAEENQEEAYDVEKSDDFQDDEDSFKEDDQIMDDQREEESDMYDAEADEPSDDEDDFYEDEDQEEDYDFKEDESDEDSDDAYEDDEAYDLQDEDAFDEFELIDQIVVVIYGQERTRIICRSELERMGLDGRPRTLNELIFEELLYQETIKYKIPVDEAAIDKYLLSLRRQNNLSMDAIREIFKRSGYTYQEGREQLGMMYASSTMIELKIMQRLSVTEQEVIEYYETHPEYKEAKYKLERAFVQFDRSVSKEEQENLILHDIETGKYAQFQWGTPFWLKESELSEVMEFVISMECGNISVPLEDYDGFELYRLVAKRPEMVVPLEQRFRQISEMLKMPKYQEELMAYQDELIDNTHIVYLVGSDEIER